MSATNRQAAESAIEKVREHADAIVEAVREGGELDEAKTVELAEHGLGLVVEGVAAVAHAALSINAKL